MMFEELLTKRKLKKTDERELPSEIDAVQRVKGGAKKAHSSSVSVDSHLWKSRIIVGIIVIAGIFTISYLAYDLIVDFISYSSGETINQIQDLPVE